MVVIRVYPKTSVERANAPPPPCLLRDTAKAESQTRSILPYTSTMQIRAHSPLQSSSVLFGVMDMARLHHWTFRTSPKIFNDALVDQVWQETVPEISVEHPFVMDFLLCLSALHQATLEAQHAM
jgi:hypothetical protein